MDFLRRRLRAALVELRRSERGIALPMALMITVIAMGFAAVPVVASINAQNGDSHSQGTNEALAAAEAGAELALLRQSGLLSEDEGAPFTACAAGATPIGAGAEAGWCPKFPAAGVARPKIGNAEFAYQVRPCYAAAGACEDVPTSETCSAAEGQLLVQIVSTGYATVAGQGVTRRIELAGCAETEGNPERIQIEDEIATLTATLTTLEAGGTPASETEATKWANERSILTTQKTTTQTEVTTYRTEVRELKEAIERLHKQGGDVEYEEIPGERYFETVKGSASNVWADGQIVGIEGLNMNNNAQVYNGGAGSNKTVKMTGSANVCGSVHYGTTFETDTSTSKSAPANCAAGRTATKGTATYPAITLPSNIATENSDFRLCTESACHAGLDPVPSSVWQRGNMSYNSSNKQLSLNYSELTLEGTAPYYLCQLILGGGSSLRAGAGKSIKIYFAPPSSCGGLNGAPQLQIANGTFVYGDSASGPQFLFVGSTTSPTSSRIELAGGARSEQFVIYAPYSQVVANNGIEMTGAIIGNTLELGGGASLNKYGTFTPPASESFLPSTETVVEKQKPPTKTSHPSKLIKELEERQTRVEVKVTTTEVVLGEIETAFLTIEREEGEAAANRVAARAAEITSIENTIESLETELRLLPPGPGGSAETLEKKSFVECVAAPPIVGEAPDEGC
jgi:hypothetical protein